MSMSPPNKLGNSNSVIKRAPPAADHVEKDSEVNFMGKNDLSYLSYYILKYLFSVIMMCVSIL